MSVLAMNSLFKNHVLAKQGDSSRQSSCVATSNRHVHFLSLFVLYFRALLHIRLFWQPQIKLKLLKIWFWDYCTLLTRLSMQML